MKYISFLLLICTITVSCGQDTEQPQKKKSKKVVEEIKAGDKISDIIRNPIDADKTVDTINVAKLVFEDKRYNFGTVDQGDVVRHVFKFTNEGKVPLLISDAKSTCGCTVPEWPNEPIAPGESGSISVRFDTKNKTERQSKPITITANTYPTKTYLHVNGFVNPKK